MFLLFVISVLCVQISMAEKLYDKSFYKSSGPYFVSKDAVNWTQAKIGCKNAHLELASIITEEEQIDLATFLEEYDLIPEDKWSGYWLSGLRHNDGKYYWDSTETEVDSLFEGWCWGEPSHAYERENCIELKWDGVKLGWNDYFCDETRRYICQIPRKYKPKAVKKETILKKLNRKEWEYKEVTTEAPMFKETGDYGNYEDYVDYSELTTPNYEFDGPEES